MAEPEIIFSAHAVEAIAERNLDPAWIVRTVTHPELREQDPRQSNLWRVFRRTEERDGRVLRVVCAARNGVTLVVTAHFDRSRRRESFI